MKIVTLILFLLFTVVACSDMKEKKTSETIETQMDTFSCLVSQSQCILPSAYGDIVVEFSGMVKAGRVETEQDFKIKAHLKSTNDEVHIKSMSAYMEGKEMFMGKVPVFFVPSSHDANIFIANTLLASCSENIMVWRVSFEVEWQGAGDLIPLQKYTLDFESVRRD